VVEGIASFFNLQAYIVLETWNDPVTVPGSIQKSPMKSTLNLCHNGRALVRGVYTNSSRVKKNLFDYLFHSSLLCIVCRHRVLILFCLRVDSSCHDIVAPISAVGHLLWQARLPGTRSLPDYLRDPSLSEDTFKRLLKT